MGSLAFATIVSGCGMSKNGHDADIAALRTEMQSEMARRDTIAVVGLTAAIAINSEQERRLANLEAGMAALDARMIEVEELAVGAIRYNAPVHFAFDSYEMVDEESVIALDRFAAVVSRFLTDALITIEGFADPAGDADYNKWLGQKRAETVMQYLVEAGVDAGQLRAVSYGDAGNRQVEPGAWGENGSANRRVAFVVDYLEGM
jgi:peptidoglycan-associated lipoprotein